jgi:N-acetylneuraminic acid mutarotase
LRRGYLVRSGVTLGRSVLIIGAALVFVIVHSRGPVFGAAGTWTVKAPMPTPRYGHAVGVANGILYAMGGDNSTTYPREYLRTVEAYNPTTNIWTAKAPMPTARSGFGVGVVNGVLYAVGGIGGPSGSVREMVEAYDPATDMWTAKGPMPGPRWGAFAVGVVKGILYVVGGENFDRTLQAYDPATNTWITRAPMPTGRNFLAAGVINGTLYAVGGSCCSPGHGGSILSTVEAYNPTTNSWTAKAPMLTPRMKFAVGVVNGTLYAVGGAGFIGTVEAYNPTTNAWSMKAPMPSARFLHSVEVVNEILYVVGGDTTQTTGDVLAFKP